jgi:hypothetical protein
LFFSFVGQFGFGYCSLAQEISSVIHYFAFGSGLLPIYSQPLLPFLYLFTDSLVGAEISSLPLSLSLVYFQCSICPLCCPCLITVCCLLFSFVREDQSAQGLCWFMFLEVDRGFPCGAHLFVLSVDAQAGLEPEAVMARNGIKFSQCNVAWGGFPWARCSGCQKFDSG